HPRWGTTSLRSPSRPLQAPHRRPLAASLSRCSTTRRCAGTSWTWEPWQGWLPAGGGWDFDRLPTTFPATPFLVACGSCLRDAERPCQKEERNLVGRDSSGGAFSEGVS